MTGPSCLRPIGRGAMNLSQPDRIPRKDREPEGLTVSPPSATIMKVAARHEAQSKIGEQVACSRERCRGPRWVVVPEILSASLRWAK
jgi:hypothetical protein